MSFSYVFSLMPVFLEKYFWSQYLLEVLTQMKFDSFACISAFILNVSGLSVCSTSPVKAA